MRKAKLISMLFISILFITILATNSVNSSIITLDQWDKAKDEEAIHSAFVFYLYLHSWFEADYLEDSEFLLGDIVDYCQVSILRKKPQELAIKATKIVFTSPSKQIYERNLSGKEDLFYAGHFTYSIEEALVHLNESGLWSVNLIFNRSDNGVFQLRYFGDYSDFTNTSEIHIFRGMNINVYTNLEYQQLRAAKALEESAEASKESKNWAIVSTIALSAAAIIAVVSIFLNYKQKMRDIKAECKSRPSERILDIRFLIKETKDLLDTLESHNYHCPASHFDTYNNINERYYKLRQRLALDATYALTFPEAKEISSSINKIFIELDTFNENYLEKLRGQTTKKIVDGARENLERLERLIREFLLIKVGLV